MPQCDRYTFEEHSHRFAAWAASRAASVKGMRFPVRDGRRIIESVGLAELLERSRIPGADQFDGQHAIWRRSIIATAGFPFELSHGVAAKLINCYLKAAIVLTSRTGALNDPRVAAIHPPVDQLLLNSIRKTCRDAATSLPTTPWSKFDSDDYEATIKVLKTLAGNRPLWTVEHYWSGHQ